MKLTASKSFRLTPEQAEALARYSQAWGRSQNEVIGRIIETADRRSASLMTPDEQKTYLPASRPTGNGWRFTAESVVAGRTAAASMLSRLAAASTWPTRSTITWRPREMAHDPDRDPDPPGTMYLTFVEHDRGKHPMPVGCTHSREL
jgi:hypothetical protein